MLHFNIDNITKSEHDAVVKATDITNQIKALLLNNEVVTLEKLTGTEALSTEGVVLLNQFIAALNSPAVASCVQLVNTFLGGLGANLTGLIHEGEVILHGIEKWIAVFEVVYHKIKGK